MRIFYHATEKQYLESIMKEGLKPQPQRWTDKLLVNLWGTFEDAVKFAKEYDFDIVLRVLTTGNMRVDEIPPERPPPGTIVDYIPEFGAEYAVYETIKPEFLKVVWKR